MCEHWARILVRKSGQFILKIQILRMKDVIALTTLSRSTINVLVRKGDFPCSIKLTEKAVGWHESAIVDWINSRQVANSPDKIR